VGRLAARLKLVRQPRSDRWSERPTPHFGGVAIYTAVLASVLLFADLDALPLTILLGTSLAFLLGLFDDIRAITPPIKLAGLIIATAVLVFGGIVLGFTPWPVVNILISFVWIVGMANAINLVDNMDGLAGGLALVAAGFLSFFFWRSGDVQLLTFSLAIAGAILGFLMYNKPPASIIMGDSGALFLGTVLATLAIARRPQASNIFAIISVPLLVFLIPIIDTTMVSITRLMRGQSPAQGGRDHTSHRLIALGLGERQALIVLVGLAVVSGLSAVLLEEWSYSLSLILLPILVVGLGLFGAYLGQSKLLDESETRGHTGSLLRAFAEFTFRRRILEVLLDFFLITFVYYLTFVISFGVPLEAAAWDFYLTSLPIMVGTTYLSFFLLGVYQGIWRYLGLSDVARIGVACFLAGALGMLAANLVFGQAAYAENASIFLLYLLVLFILIVFTRLSFRLFDRFFERRRATLAGPAVPVLIYGAGDAGELVLRECARNHALGYQPVAFIDDDPAKIGRSLSGLSVLGAGKDLVRVLEKTRSRGLIISSVEIELEQLPADVLEYLRANKVWVKSLQLAFKDLGFTS
jgi:UDP-GlcNAc:undecaprenyl-phosphate GlcNAc-1-phosphate transferase